jgi:starvation-inducible DNA-binding protein
MHLNYMPTSKTHTNGAKAAPKLGQRAEPIQKYDTVINLPVGLDEKTRLESTRDLNQLLADTIMLRDLYKKAHWQVSGHTFYQLHLLFDKHYREQAELVDEIAERIQSLGGVAIAVAPDVAEHTRLERPPIDREEVPVQISRLLEGHEVILKEAREYAKAASERDDDGTNDLIVSDVIRTNEVQIWFVSEHLVDLPVVTAK